MDVECEHLKIFAHILSLHTKNKYYIREGILNQNKYLILKQTKDNSTIS